MLSLAPRNTSPLFRVATPVAFQPSHRSRCHRFRVRASDDEDVIPIFSGHRKTEFNAVDYERLSHPKLLGGKTIGEELAMIRARYLDAEAQAEAEVARRLSSSQWYVNLPSFDVHSPQYHSSPSMQGWRCLHWLTLEYTFRHLPHIPTIHRWGWFVCLFELRTPLGYHSRTILRLCPPKYDVALRLKT